MTICKQAAGTFKPVINRNRCEGKGPCVEVCPYDVLGMFVLPAEIRSELSLVGRIKGFAHRWNQAVVLEADQCQACGLCVSACPEKAIKLVRTET